MNEAERRKEEHIDAVLSGTVGARALRTGLETVRFVHGALPEMHLDAVDLSTSFLGKRLRAPLVISSMTGGPSRAAPINRALAEAAQETGIAFAVGSQRVALEGGGGAGFAQLRQRAPDVPLLANIGAAQLNRGYGADEARRAVEMIGADALILHLNPLQEAVQPEGDRDWSGILEKIAALAGTLPVPLAVKEVGFGISGETAERLREAGVEIIDVAGAGGTSWAAVEAARAPSERHRRIAETFRDWGIPTAVALQETRRACPDAIVVASGGLRTGLDAAAAIRLGADLCGFAAPLLASAVAGTREAVEAIEMIIEELRIVCFATGSADLASLRIAPLVESG